MVFGVGHPHNLCFNSPLDASELVKVWEPPVHTTCGDFSYMGMAPPLHHPREQSPLS